MDGQKVLFEFFWVKWTIPLIAAAIAGTIGAIATLYKIYERWSTREQRRLDMLHEYLDKEERNITAKRTEVFTGIQQAHSSILAGKRFDVGAEIDEAIRLLDNGKPHRAAGRLAELEKKLELNASILERRAEDLRRHKASVQIFQAALAEQDAKPDVGLDHIARALQSNARDLDALKYQGVLYLSQGELENAERAFDRLRQFSVGDDNLGPRADAHLGLASVHIARGVSSYGDAFQSLTTALNNLMRLPPSAQDRLTKAYIHQQFGLVLNSDWDGADAEGAREHLQRAREVLSEIPHRRGLARQRYDEVSSAIASLAPPRGSQ